MTDREKAFFLCGIVIAGSYLSNGRCVEDIFYGAVDALHFPEDLIDAVFDGAIGRSNDALRSVSAASTTRRATDDN